MKIPSELKTVISIIMVVVVLIALVYVGGYLGFTAGMITDYATLLPGLVIFVVGTAMLRVTGTGSFAVPAFGLVGIGLAILVGEMNTVGVLIPDILTATFTIADLQLVVIIFFVLLGAIPAALESRRRW